MAHEGTGRIGWAGWLWRGVILCALVLALVRSFASLAGTLDRTATDAQDALGYSSPIVPGLVVGHPHAGPRWIPVSNVDPQGAASAGGVSPGDEIRFDRPFGQLVAWRPGSRVGVAVARGVRRFHALTIARSPAESSLAPKLGSIGNDVAIIGFNLFAVFVLTRGWRNRSALLLAATFISLYTPTYLPQMPSMLTTSVALVSMVLASGIGGLWPMFAMEVSGGASSPRMARVVYAFAFIEIAFDGFFHLATDVPFDVPFGGSAARGFSVALSNAIAAAVLIYNFRRGDAQMRNRIKIVWLAFACLVTGSLVLMASLTLPLAPASAEAILLALGYPVMGYIGLGLFTYAVLKHRALDFGFAINRTLVYGAVSFVLLAAFGLAEWASERLMPASWHQGSMLVSAGVAVALFLSFHRLRDWIEHYTARLFFARWQQAEAELKRFVASAGHFEQAPALCRGFEAALARFAGAEAAVYLRGSDGTYRLQCGEFGGAPAAFADDDPAFALMRAERQPLDLTRLDAALPGALALPMLDVGTLTGFVLLGAKPDGAQYRPDEVDNLGWAAHQVGLDLQALHARELEAENASLREKVAWLSAPKPRRPRTKPPLVALPGGAAS